MERSIGIEGHPESIMMWEEGEYWIIKHQETGVTTQGKNRLHALLMLADAIAAYTDSDEDLLELSEDVFELSDEQEQFMREISEED